MVLVTPTRSPSSCIDAFLDAVQPTEKLTLLLHDCGSALGIDWARHYEDGIAGLAFMEFVLPADSWKVFPPAVIITKAIAERLIQKL